MPSGIDNTKQAVRGNSQIKMIARYYKAGDISVEIFSADVVYYFAIFIKSVRFNGHL